ncbi:MAG: helix-turn-helix domain-containing protein [Candidatus Obscuribacterales bacterium]|nr:helix-turn-helix domain-containing protein [Candidatus Obscuribacterales bacterium]
MDANDKPPLTVAKVADELNVSEKYVVGLLDDGKLPFSETTDGRIVAYADLVAYKQQRELRRQAAMDELVAQAQELGLGY